MKPVTIYTTMLCGYCSRAKALLKKKGAAFEEVSAGWNPAKRAEMIERANGGASFPQIFIGDEHIGGCDELYALDRAGALDAKLANA